MDPLIVDIYRPKRKGLDTREELRAIRKIHLTKFSVSFRFSDNYILRMLVTCLSNKMYAYLAKNTRL
jgi:hypothetical protein